jgi:hypothetical protein
MLQVVFDKYRYYHNVWHCKHPNFFFTHIVWNALVFAVALLFFLFLFMVVNLFQNVYIELLYAIAISTQLTYLLYRHFLFSTLDFHTVQHYEDAFILSAGVSLYLYLQTIVSFILISGMNHHKLVYPMFFLLLYFSLCTVYLYVDGSFFYHLWKNDRWRNLIDKQRQTAAFEEFMGELRRRSETRALVFFEKAYEADSSQTIESMVDVFETMPSNPTAV